MNLTHQFTLSALMAGLSNRSQGRGRGENSVALTWYRLRLGALFFVDADWGGVVDSLVEGAFGMAASGGW